MPGRRKGRGTGSQVRAITPEGRAALERFAAAQAWGRVASSTRLIVWRRAIEKVRAAHPDWPIPPGCRPYDFRHSFGELAYRATHDLALVQGLLGHADQRTTRRYAAGAIPEGEAAAAAKVSALWQAQQTAPTATALQAPGRKASPRGKSRGAKRRRKR